MSRISSLDRTSMSLGLALALLLVTARPSLAVEGLRPSLAELSDQLARLLRGRGEDALAVGAFTASHAVASSGPGIQRILLEELEKRGVAVRNRANLEVKGDYLAVRDKDAPLLGLRLIATVRNRAGDVVVVFDKLRKIDNREVLAQVLGLTRPDLGAGITPERESEETVLRLDQPSVEITDTHVRAERKRPYAVEILVKADGRYQPRQPVDQEGLAYVPIARDEVFAVNLINDSPHDAAVELTLDGLSVFAFSAGKQYRHIIVPRKSSALIKGWHRTNEQSDEFIITQYARSAAAELLASPDQVGTITATFSAAWDPAEAPPQDEGSKFRDPLNPAVGRGQPVRTPYKEVRREHGRMRDVVSVRYKKPE